MADTEASSGLLKALATVTIQQAVLSWANPENGCGWGRWYEKNVTCMETLTPNIHFQKHLFSLERTLFGPTPLTGWHCCPTQRSIPGTSKWTACCAHALVLEFLSVPPLPPSGPCPGVGIMLWWHEKSRASESARIVCPFKVWNYSRTKSFERLAACVSIRLPLHTFRGGLLIDLFASPFLPIVLVLSWVNFNL